jgi:hypothetical protein
VNSLVLSQRHHSVEAAIQAYFEQDHVADVETLDVSDDDGYVDHEFRENKQILDGAVPRNWFLRRAGTMLLRLAVYVSQMWRSMFDLVTTACCVRNFGRESSWPSWLVTCVWVGFSAGNDRRSHGIAFS